MRNKLLVGALALAMTCTTVFSSVAPATVKAASVSTVQTQTATNSNDYVYCYAGLTWAEYWKSEGVYLNGTDLGASSDTVDGNNEYDTGAFDALSRATTKHGYARASFQTMLTMTGTDGNGKTYSVDVVRWDNDDVGYATDGTTVKFSKPRGETPTLIITYPNQEPITVNYTSLTSTGIKYVPVAVKKSDYTAFAAKYPVVENGGTLQGGSPKEGQMKEFSLTANVTANTNGLKYATKTGNDSFTFSARKTGTDSGIADATQKTADLNSLSPNIAITDVTDPDATVTGEFGEFLRVDFKEKASDTTEGYGALGAKMQAVKWTYYGSDSTRTKALVNYGTKFEADNWMHSSMGIQLGLTKSLRCQLPANTSGTGYWRLTIYALGYKDSTFDFVVNSDNIADLLTDDATDKKDISTLAATIASVESKKLNKNDYTSASWTKLESALKAAKVQIINPTAQTAIDAANTDVEAAVKALAKKPAATTTQNKTNTTTAKKPATKPALKKANVKLSKPALKVGKTTKNKAKVTWKKIKKATGYEIQYTTKSFSNKKTTKTIKVSKAKITSAQLKKLKKKTKYKVRIRAVYSKAGYQTVTSKWSATKTVKTK